MAADRADLRITGRGQDPILGFGPEAVVLEPADIRDAVVGAAAQLVRLRGR